MTDNQNTEKWCQIDTKMRSMMNFEICLDAPTSRVWQLITDTETWPCWGPSVRKVDSPERFIRTGLKGRILTPFGIWAPFSIEKFQPERYWDWRVSGIPATGHLVEPMDSHKSRLIFTVPAWALPYGFVCRIALNKIKQLIALSSKTVSL